MAANVFDPNKNTQLDANQLKEAYYAENARHKPVVENRDFAKSGFLTTGQKLLARAPKIAGLAAGFLFVAGAILAAGTGFLNHNPFQEKPTTPKDTPTSLPAKQLKH